MASEPKGNRVVLQYFPGYFLLGCLFISTFFLFSIYRPFFGTILLAAILAAAFYPVYIRLVKLFRNRSRIASFVTCLLIIILIIIPLIFFVLLLARQGIDIYLFVQHKIQGGDFDALLKWQQGNLFYDFFDPQHGQLGALIDIQSFDLKQTLTDAAKTVSSFLVAQTAGLVKGFGGLALSFFLLFFTMYYFFKDGHLILKKLMQISPLPLRHEHEVFRKFKEISRIALFGIFLTAMAQGIVGGIGFVIVGVPNPVFWGTAIAVFSLIPVVGTALVWLPTSILLFLTGNTFGGIFLFFWGLLLVSTIDNFLRAYLIGNQANINPLLAFFAVFGGIGVFGLPGLLFGPLILTVFFTFLHIYELEYKSVLKH